ncbi:MAG: hypothetical protein PHD06_02255 [Bacteroidales bacterium]|nr:hypothetical protein [Bacteroidales bacterium]MDD4383982.1 hypothetical protein [Bacteroidales bacterium]MDY0196524.1 hypothetical protein [Tenuifilaceae bacterium]
MSRSRILQLISRLRSPFGVMLTKLYALADIDDLSEMLYNQLLI